MAFSGCWVIGGLLLVGCGCSSGGHDDEGVERQTGGQSAFDGGARETGGGHAASTAGAGAGQGGTASRPLPTGGSELSAGSGVAGTSAFSTAGKGMSGSDSMASAGAPSAGSEALGSGGNTGGEAGNEAGAAGAPGRAGAPGTGGMVSEADLPEPMATAGFIDLEPADYSYEPSLDPRERRARTSSSARLFYSFVPAEQEPRGAPVFVFFNGGPGASTTGFLRVYGTGPHTLDAAAGDAVPLQNAHSWATLGNLLYIDSRLAGFSYSRLENPADALLRDAELTEANFNEYIDAADFVRTLLRFLESQPALRNNPVVVVGESYGGVRATLMLHMLLDSSSISTENGGPFSDPALAEEIRAHYAVAFPSEDPTQVRGAQAARQFGWQVLVQPALAFGMQSRQDPCDLRYSPAAWAQEQGLDCRPEGRDPHHWGMPADWTDGLEIAARQALLTPTGFSSLVGVAPDSVSGLSAADRIGAFRLFSEDDLTDAPREWTGLLGEIPPYDSYFTGMNSALSNFYGAQIRADRTALDGMFFLENLRYVNTLITRAELDAVVISDGIPDVLRWYVDGTTPPIVTDVTVDLATRDGVARSGWITVTYGQMPGVDSGETRVIRFPTYRDCGHMVSVSSPAELYEDVRTFIEGSLGSVQAP
ncbi:MAG: hypothetical protein JW940_08825 [Polyangiaceae bacterium]|nr:hypothetical protein [Polyangiaceae bacterium]